MDGIEAPAIAKKARDLDALAEGLERTLGTLEAITDTAERERHGIRRDFIREGYAIALSMRDDAEELRKPLREDGRDATNGRLLDPIDARRRSAVLRGWKPSRHPESDREYFTGVRDWPGERLALKRFNVNGDVENGWLELKVKYATNSGRIFQLTRPPGRRDRRETATSMITVDELIAECWEVD